MGPAVLHQIPLEVGEGGEPLRPQALPHTAPQLVLAAAGLEVLGQLDGAGADVPEQDAERVDVHTGAVLGVEHLGTHVNGCAHY